MVPWSAPPPPLPEWRPHQEEAGHAHREADFRASILQGWQSPVGVLGNRPEGALGLAAGGVAWPVPIMVGTKEG